MKISTLVSTAALAVLGGFSAHAKLGDTVAMIEARWGKPIGANSERSRYSRNGIVLEVVYLRGASVCETYWKETYPAGTQTKGFSDEEAKRYRELYGDGQIWTLSTKGVRWLRADKEVTCTQLGDQLTFRAEAHAKFPRE